MPDEMQQLFHNEQYLNVLTQGLNRIDAILQSEYPRTNENFDKLSFHLHPVQNLFKCPLRFLP